MSKYYGFLQSNHGADHVFVFTEDQLQELFDYYGGDMDELPTDPEETTEIDGFPMGGSNSSASIVTLLETKEDVLSFLQEPALGPDLEDPMLVDMAEYYFGIDNGNWGCGNGLAAKMLEDAGFDVEKVEEKAMQGVEFETDLAKSVLGIDRKDFYDDPYYSMRMSDIHVLGDIKALLNEVSSLDFEKSDGKVLIERDLSAEKASFHQSLSIWKTEDGEYSWKLTHENKISNGRSWTREFTSDSWETDEEEALEIFHDIIQKAIEEKDPKGLSKDEEERE